MFDTRGVPSVVRAAEFGDPQPRFIFDDSFRPCPAHRRSDEHQVLYLLAGRVSRAFFVGNDGIGYRLHIGGIEGLIESLPWIKRGRN